MTGHIEVASPVVIPTSGEFRIEVTVLGAERSVETSYGPRTERDTLARLDIPVNASTAYRIFREAFAAASIPPPIHFTFPEVSPPS